MEGIVDDALRQGDYETLNSLPQIPYKLFLTPKSVNDKEAPRRGASIIVCFYLKKSPFLVTLKNALLAISQLHPKF